MDRPIANTVQRRNKARGWLRWGVGLALLGAGFLIFRQLLKTNIELKDFRIAKVEVGMMEDAITAAGVVVPTFEQQLNAPIASEIETVYLTSGAQVKTGDSIMELNEEFTRLEYESLVDQLELKKNNITKLGLEYDKNLQELTYEDQIKALQLSSLEAELADKKRLREIGGTTLEEVEQAALNLKIAQLEKKKLENDLNFKKASIVSDRRNLELEVMIQEKKLKELGKKLTQTKVTAPNAGVITWIAEEIGKKINEGEPLVRLANLESFRVEATCSDRYANKINMGLPVRVRVNRVDLQGYISSILPAINNNSISFIVELDKNNHESLRPDMRVEVFIIAERAEDVLKVANGPAFKGGIQQNVFVVEGEKAVKRKVRVGLTNMDFVQITQGLQQGDRIIISDMEDYDHLEELTIEN